MRFTGKLEQLGVNAAGRGKNRARHHAVHRHVELASEQDRHRRTDCRMLGGKRRDGRGFPTQQVRYAMSGDVCAMEGGSGIGAKHLTGAMLGELLRPPINTDRLHTHGTVDDKPAMRGNVALMRDGRLVREFLMIQELVQQMRLAIRAAEDRPDGRDALSDIQRPCPRFVPPSGSLYIPMPMRADR